MAKGTKGKSKKVEETSKAKARPGGVAKLPAGVEAPSAGKAPSATVADVGPAVPRWAPADVPIPKKGLESRYYDALETNRGYTRALDEFTRVPAESLAVAGLPETGTVNGNVSNVFRVDPDTYAVYEGDIKSPDPMRYKAGFDYGYASYEDRMYELGYDSIADRNKANLLRRVQDQLDRTNPGPGGRVEYDFLAPSETAQMLGGLRTLPGGYTGLKSGPLGIPWAVVKATSASRGSATSELYNYKKYGAYPGLSNSARAALQGVYNGDYYHPGSVYMLGRTPVRLTDGIRFGGRYYEPGEYMAQARFSDHVAGVDFDGAGSIFGGTAAGDRYNTSPAVRRGDAPAVFAGSAYNVAPAWFRSGGRLVAPDGNPGLVTFNPGLRDTMLSERYPMAGDETVSSYKPVFGGIRLVPFRDFQERIREYNRDPETDPRWKIKWDGGTTLDAKGGEAADVHADSKGGDSVRAAEEGGEAAQEEVPQEQTPQEQTPQEQTPQEHGGGPRIVINPKVFRDKRDALCVAMNEAFRILMEDQGFDPMSEPTEKQRKFFSDTAYADDEQQLRRTIIARICTFDTSVSDPTPDQIAESLEFLQGVMEAGIPQNQWEQKAVKRIATVLQKSNGAPKAGDQPDAPEDEGTVQADVGGGRSRWYLPDESVDGSKVEITDDWKHHATEVGDGTYLQFVSAEAGDPAGAVYDHYDAEGNRIGRIENALMDGESGGLDVNGTFGNLVHKYDESLTVRPDGTGAGNAALYRDGKYVGTSHMGLIPDTMPEEELSELPPGPVQETAPGLEPRRPGPEPKTPVPPRPPEDGDGIVSRPDATGKSDLTISDVGKKIAQRGTYQLKDLNGRDMLIEYNGMGSATQYNGAGLVPGANISGLRRTELEDGAFSLTGTVNGVEKRLYFDKNGQQQRRYYDKETKLELTSASGKKYSIHYDASTGEATQVGLGKTVKLTGFKRTDNADGSFSLTGTNGSGRQQTLNFSGSNRQIAPTPRRPKTPVAPIKPQDLTSRMRETGAYLDGNLWRTRTGMRIGGSDVAEDYLEKYARAKKIGGYYDHGVWRDRNGSRLRNF